MRLRALVRNRTRIIRILTDPVYIGKLRFQEEVFDGKHAPIIDLELFESVQAVLRKNRECNGAYRDQTQHVFLLQGLIRCGSCGSFMTPKASTGRGGKKHFYYNCTSNSHSAGTECDAKYVPAEAAEQYILDEVRKISASPMEIQRIVELANEQKDERVERLERDRDAMRQSKSEIDKRLKVILAKIEGGLNSATLEERMIELEAQSRDLRDQLATIAAERNQIIQDSLSLEVMAETLPRLSGNAGRGHQGRGSVHRQRSHRPAHRGHQLAPDPRRPHFRAGRGHAFSGGVRRVRYQRNRRRATD